jgi:hypothetical protein
VLVQPIGIRDPVATGTRPAVAALHAAVPNPFNPRTRIGFDVPGEVGGARQVRLAIYDVSGRRVRTLVAGRIETGQHSVVWDGSSDRGSAVVSGVYFARLEVDSFAATRKLVMIR